MDGEHDFVILVKNIGVILVEVKASSSPGNVGKDEKQLNSGQSFVRSLLNAISTNSTLFPVTKLILSIHPRLLRSLRLAAVIEFTRMSSRTSKTSSLKYQAH